MIDDLDDAAEAMRDSIVASLPDRLDRASPCEGWTVRNVINHVVTGNLRTVAWTQAENGPRNEEDHLGDNPLGAFDASYRQVRTRLAELIVGGRPVQTPFALLSIDRLIEMRSTELVVHAWDIARATDKSTAFLPDLCERLLLHARSDIDGLDRTGSPFDAEQPPPSGASEADRLAAFFGRTL